MHRFGSNSAMLLKEPTQPSGLSRPTQNPEHNTKRSKHSLVVITYFRATEWTKNNIKKTSPEHNLCSFFSLSDHTVIHSNLELFFHCQPWGMRGDPLCVTSRLKMFIFFNDKVMWVFLFLQIEQMFLFPTWEWWVTFIRCGSSQYYLTSVYPNAFLYCS